MKKMLIIDGNSILNRAYYGIRPLTNKNGLYTHAVYGMVNIISRHIDTIKPDFCAVAFDLKAPTFRHKMYDAYKANRKGMPDELAVQLPYAKKCMEYLGFKVITKEGYEADDILGTLAKQASEEDVHAYILTGDRDSLQLIEENVSVLLVKTKETLEYNRELFLETYGVEPDAFVDVKALMGDSSDNIPGVAGIGEKTALKLIADFGSMDKLYASFESAKLSDSVKQKLRTGRDMAYLSRELATIDNKSPIDVTVGDCSYTGIHKQELYELFAELEFSALIKKFGLEGITPIKNIKNDITIKNDAVEINCEKAKEYFKSKKIALFADTDAVEIFDGHMSAVLPWDEDMSFLADNMIVCHDFKQLYKKFLDKGVHIERCAFDTMLAAYVLNSGRSKYLLEDLSVAYLGGADDTIKKSVLVYRLYEVLEKEIEKENCVSLLYDIEIPLARVLADMERVGFKIDCEGIKKYGEELASTAEALTSRIYSMAGEEFNINSPKQLGEVLFEKMGLPKSKKTKTGYSTDAETLQKLSSRHEIIADILEYRQVTKLKSTYAEGLFAAADENGCIHTVFNQTGTATGRLSSAEPNLQNIPIRTQMGRRFRKYFVPKSKEYVLVDADYSQIELRLLAHISNDENMINAFLSGEDIHTMTACRVFGVDANDVDTELRKRAKAVNFGIVYGIGEHSLSEDLHISRAEAKKYIDSYLAGFPNVKDYLENIKKKAREDGYVVTEFGRKRYIPELSASNKNVQHFGERVAMNSPIQGTAADIIKIAMIKTARALADRNLDARLVLQVHDELLIECNHNCAEEAKQILKDCMEGAVDFRVPLNVEVNIGETWYNAK